LLAVQRRVGLERDEELRPIRAGAAVGHGEKAGLVVLAIAIELAGELVARVVCHNYVELHIVVTHNN